MPNDRPPGPASSAPPHLTARATAALAERRAREAAALRENLHRRKAKTRAAAAPAPTVDPLNAPRKP